MRPGRVLAVLAVPVLVLAGVGLLRADLAAVQSGIDRLLGKFSVAEIGERSLDGAPALAVTFTEPLDPKASYDKHLSVIEMPPRPGETRVQPEAEEGEECCSEERGPDASRNAQVSTAPADVDTTGGKRVKGAWVVGENPRILYFPNVRPQVRYVVRVGAALADARGNALQAESKASVRTAAVTPAYYFASRGMVLPARQNGGLPVVTVNVPEVDLQFLRVRNRDLPKFLDQVVRGRATPASASRCAADAGEGDDCEDEWRYEQRGSSLQGAIYNWDLDAIHSITQSVYTGRFLTEKRPNRRTVTHLAVEDIKELQEPGVYVAVMSQPGRFRQEYQVTYFYVSDLGLHVKLWEKSADAWVSSLTDGKAVAGVEVSFIDAQGKTLSAAKTDADGRARFAERPAGARVVLARRTTAQGAQVSMIALKEPALDLSEYEIAGNPYKPVRLFAWAGRDLYRPGEQFTVSVLARDADGRPVPPQPLEARLKQPDGKVLLTSAWTPDRTHAGYYQRRIELPADAATGFWNLELRADPADKVPSTVMRFGVEEFLPEKMKLELSAPATPLDPEATLPVSVKGAYLYGAPAGGNRVLSVVQFERNRNPLAAVLPGFEFGDSGEDAVKFREELPEGETDAQGQAELEVPLAKLARRRSPFTVRTTVSLLESGGRPIVRSIERVSWPAQKLVGVRPLFVGDYAKEGSLAEFEVVRVDPSGKLLAGNALEVRLFREDRNWYWRFDDQRGWNSGFTETDELVETTLASTPAGGRGRLAVPVRYGRYRLEIIDPETGQASRYRFYAGWSARGDETQGIRPDKVALRLDKPAYRAGETAKLSVVPPHAGEIIVTVEGGGALWTKRMSIAAEGATVELPIAAEWARHDLYVSVIALRPGNQGDRVTPTRAVGLVHLPLERGERRLAVSLEAPAKTTPSRSVSVKVKVPDAKGQNALVTLSAVDVGILNITRFATPDPLGFYFGRQRYGADLHDVYGRLIEKMAGRKGRLKWGGDTTPKPARGLPQKTLLVDLFNGPVKLDANGEADIPLELPDFNGSLRLMAVVAAPERFGAADVEMKVAAPVVAELLTPRFLTFGDQATIALDLTNLTGAEQKFKVVLSGASAVSVADGTRTVGLKNEQKQTLRFTVAAGQEHGLAELRLRVEGGGTLERRFPLMVQAPTQQQRIARRFALEPGRGTDLRDPDLGGLARTGLAAQLVISDRPPIDVRSAVRGLLTYPYGCAEQTTSTAYPHVFVDEAAARELGLKPYTREDRQKMLDSAFGRLGAMQNPQGGFSLWGRGGYDVWLSAYVTRFLQDARDAGFAPPPAMLDKARDFLLTQLQEGTARLPSGSAARGESADFNALAQAGFVLSRDGKAPLSTLRQLAELRGSAGAGLALVNLGAALLAMGDEPRGRTLVDEGLGKLRVGDAPRYWEHYGSPLRDAALAYVVLGQARVAFPARERLVDTIAAELATQRWFSTQEQLALFLVGRDFAAAAGGEWTVELKPARAGARPETLRQKGTAYRELSAEDVAAGVNLGVAQGAGRLYAELVLTGFAARALPPKSDPIRLLRTLYTPDGQPLGKRPLKVGDTVVVRVEVASRVAIANALVVDRIPAGLEIENRNLVQGEAAGGTSFDGQDPVRTMADSRIQHVEYRDDRFVAAVAFSGQGYGNDRPVQLFYRARVVTPGRFLVPPLYAEDMYRPEVFGLAGGTETIVVTDAPAAK